MYMNYSTNFRGLLFKEEMAPSWLKGMNSVFSEFTKGIRQIRILFLMLFSNFSWRVLTLGHHQEEKVFEPFLRIWSALKEAIKNVDIADSFMKLIYWCEHLQFTVYIFIYIYICNEDVWFMNFSLGLEGTRFKLTLANQLIYLFIQMLGWSNFILRPWD